MSDSGWVVPNFYKAPQDSLFDKEYDYFVSLGHRCCVGQALNYMRKSSFPFDWQVTKMSALASIFKNEFKNVSDKLLRQVDELQSKRLQRLY